jgi:hypothetical protein
MGDERPALDLPVNSPQALLEMCATHCSELFDAVNAYNRRLPGVVRRLVASAPHPSVGLVATQSLNDFNDLLLDALSGRGGSATRAARALFEDALNLLAVVDDEAMADRYISHWSIAVEHSQGWDPLSKYLTGKRLKAARHHSRKLSREIAVEVREALSKYGESFLRSWHPDSIASRARAAGLEQQYSFYRYSSAALHGAAIGGVGTFWAHDGDLLYRVGPATMPCPPALCAGLVFMRRVLGSIQRFCPTAAASLHRSVDEIEAQMMDFMQYTQRPRENDAG